MTTMARRQSRPWRRPARHLELGAVLLVLAVPALLAFGVPQALEAPDWLTGIVGGAGAVTAYGFAGAGFYLILDSHRRLARFAALAALPLAIVGVVVHNVFYGVTGLEEGAFFLVAVLYAPMLLAAAVTRLLRSR